MSTMLRRPIVLLIIIFLLLLTLRGERGPNSSNGTTLGPTDQLMLRKSADRASAELDRAGRPANVAAGSGAPTGVKRPRDASSGGPAGPSEGAAGAPENQATEGAEVRIRGVRDAEGAPTSSRIVAYAHRVVDGDTLRSLAARYLGDEERYLELFEANRAVLTHPELLPLGTTLRLPSLDEHQ